MATKKKAAKPRKAAKLRKAVKPRAQRAAPRKQAKVRGTARKKSDGLRVRSATPTYTVNDLDKSIDWYCKGLGFTESERWEDNGKLMGVMLKAGDCTFGLSQDDFAKGRDREKGAGFRMYLSTTQDVDALAERIRAYGGKIIQEPTEVPWAKRTFAVEDPDGFKLSIDQAKR